jgi:hypothetical protein
MSVVMLTKPTELKEAESFVDAYEAFLYAMYSLKTPNYLVLQHELATADSTFYIAGGPKINLDGALSFVKMLHECTQNLGQDHRTTELAYSTDGKRMACLDHLRLTLTRPVALPNGAQLDLHPGQSRRDLCLSMAHYLRLTEDDGSHKIAEWRISSDISDFYELLA